MIVGTFSFRGEVRVVLHNPGSDLLRSERRVVLCAPDGARRSVEMSVRPGAGNRIIGRISGVSDDAEATALRGYRVLLPTAELPATEADEYYVWQLVGCAVEVDGRAVGRVTDVQHAGPYDILEVAPAQGDTWYVPARKEFVLEVDVAARRVVVSRSALDEDGP